VPVGAAGQPSAYEGLADDWDRGAGAIYQPLARALVAASPEALTGRLVLDVGTGTGAIADAAEVAGARVVAADRSHDMAAFGAGRRPSAVGDVLALPFRDGAFFAVVAGFVVNHVPPAAALAELARVVGPGGVVLASTWSGGPRDPVKAAVDGVLCGWGWEPPPWYRAMKAEIEPVSGDPARLAAAAEAAGLVEVRATGGSIDVGPVDPAVAVEYRLALPHVAPWFAGLSPEAGSEVRADARRALGRFGGWRPSIIVLVGRRPQSSRRPHRSSAGA
jgi:SAM-dependent methyltransferase